MIAIKSEDTMAPQVGFEPTTYRLTAGCSTVELLWNAICILTGCSKEVKRFSETILKNL